MLESLIESSEVGSRQQLNTPSKNERIIFSTGSGNEENEENNSIIPSSGQGQTKRPKVGTSPQTKMVSQQMDRDFDCGSECGTEASSTVTARREWLKEFGKQHENTFPKRATEHRDIFKSPQAKKIPLRSSKDCPLTNTSSSSAAASASTLVTKLVSEPKKFSTPIRKPRSQKEGVQATNDGYASVAQLSQWLANDPTSTKKKRHVRRGKNVINKSRQFEKDREDVIIIESSISRGAVSNKKKWLKDAFHDQEGVESITPQLPRYAKSEAGAYDNASSISVSDKKDWLKRAFKKRGDTEQEETKPTPIQESRCEIITDDAASSLSVSDKKDWLRNAFKKSDGMRKSRNHAAAYPKAQTDILNMRSATVDDAASRAKRKFLERSCREKASTPQKTLSQQKTKSAIASRHPLHATAVASSARMHEREVGSQPPNREHVTRQERTDISTGDAREAPPSIENSSSHDEDTTPVDFGNARKALIQRSRRNGHNAQVVNKVFLKKNKFEKWEQEMIRGTGPKGLMKASWSQADTATGRPSRGVYEKSFVPDIAPKKSFEDLP